MIQTKAPPIQWIPVFEAVARLSSFKQAAEELHVTPPAVSQQIKVLEDYLGVTLFDRSERRPRLTPAGEHYYRVARDIMQRHLKGYRDFQRIYQNPTLLVSAPLFVAQELLIPNYLGFRERAPGVELRIMTGSEFVDFENEAIDAAIRFGQGNWPELECRLLCRVELGVVCAPAYRDARGLSGLTWEQLKLEQQVLISTKQDISDWRRHVPDLDPLDRIICDSYYAAVRVAQQGLGLTYGLKPVINAWLQDGRLVELDAKPPESNMAYWLVIPRETRLREPIEALQRWVQGLFDALV